jgi:hypothetical protein
MKAQTRPNDPANVFKTPSHDSARTETDGDIHGGPRRFNNYGRREPLTKSGQACGPLLPGAQEQSLLGAITNRAAKC